MSAFVGRAAERARLAALLDGAAAGRGRVVFITGEAGAGKSSLVEQVRTEGVERQPDLLVLHAACSEQFGSGEPYQPFIDAFHDLIVDVQTQGSRWTHLRELAAELAPTWIAAIPLAGNVIAATMTTAVELRRLGSGASAASEEALFFQYTEALLAAASERPILLVLDDLHWADGATVSLLTHIARRIASERLLILGTYRPADVDVSRHVIREARLELERYSLAEEMPLPPLDRSALVELATTLLGGPPSRDLLGWMEEHAGANPLFFQELLRWCVDQGIAKQREGEWGLERLPLAVEVPRSAEAAIERRLQRLDPDTYRILEYASVQGDEFSATLLAQLLDTDELALEETLESIARTHRLVSYVETWDLPGGDITSVYRFAHSLIQDVLQGQLQGKRRILLHRRMAELLESLYGNGADAVAHRLAVHCDEGRLPERAFHFAVAGADHASKLYAHRDAIGLLARALKNSATDAQRAEALRRLGEENRLIGRLSEAQDAFNEALSLRETSGAEAEAVGLRRRLLMVKRQLGTPRESIEAELRGLLERARSVDATTEHCHLLWLWSNLPGVSTRDATGLCREALDLADASGDPELRAAARYALGRVLALGPDPRQGLEPLHECIERCPQQDRQRLANARNVIGIIHVKLGDYRSAAREFEETARTFDEIVDPVNEAAVRNNLSVLQTRLGEWEAAERNLEEALRIARRMGAETRAHGPLENLAHLAEARGDWADAIARWKNVLERGREGGWWNVQVIARAGLGRAHAALGAIEDAVRERDEAHALLPDGDVASEAALALYQLDARLAAMQGNVDVALSRLDQVEPVLERSDRYEWAAAQVLRAEILASGDRPAASEAVDEALAVLQPLGTEPLLERARGILAGKAAG